MSNSSDPSFNRTIVYNEAVSYPGGTWTPRAGSALLLSATSTSINRETLLVWFEQSLLPLVGKDAATSLMELIKSSKEGAAFTDQMLKYRLSIE